MPDQSVLALFFSRSSMQKKLQVYLLLMLNLYLPRAMPQSWRDVDLDVFLRPES
jgi:hypothetical protein